MYCLLSEFYSWLSYLDTAKTSKGNENTVVSPENKL